MTTRTPQFPSSKSKAPPQSERDAGIAQDNKLKARLAFMFQHGCLPQGETPTPAEARVLELLNQSDQSTDRGSVVNFPKGRKQSDSEIIQEEIAARGLADEDALWFSKGARIGLRIEKNSMPGKSQAFNILQFPARPRKPE